MAITFWNGKILFVGSKIATNTYCCCGTGGGGSPWFFESGKTYYANFSAPDATILDGKSVALSVNEGEDPILQVLSSASEIITNCTTGTIPLTVTVRQNSDLTPRSGESSCDIYEIQVTYDDPSCVDRSGWIRVEQIGRAHV